jgi:hypothetical protein
MVPMLISSKSVFIQSLAENFAQDVNSPANIPYQPLRSSQVTFLIFFVFLLFLLTISSAFLRNNVE